MNSDPQFGSTTASVQDFRLDQIIRSDALAKLNEFRKLNPVLREAIEEPVQIQLVLDACIVQQELRFRLRHKKKREARTSLQEILDSGTVLPFAPPKLIEEVEEHVEEIATYCNASIGTTSHIGRYALKSGLTRFIPRMITLNLWECRRS